METEQVNLIIGKFSPFTNGHLQLCKDLFEHNGLKTFVVCIRRVKTENILSDELLKKMMNSMCKEYPELIAGWMDIESYYFSDVFLKVPEQFEIKCIGCGCDREKDYKDMITHLVEDNVINKNDVDLYVSNRSDGISATKLRDAIVANDETTIENMLPTNLYTCLVKFRKEFNIKE